MSEFDVIVSNKMQRKTSFVRETVRATLSLIAISGALAVLMNMPPY